jgi:cytochrome c oxidase assembly protein subunit 15
VSLGALWLIVATGAAVRLTGSGLGCRHWPGCESGHALPAKDYHAYIEFGNRVVGGVTIVLTLLTALAALRTTGLGRGARRLAWAIFGGTLAQAPLGLLAVTTDLRWPIVMAHLLLSIALLGAAVVLVLETLRVRNGAAAPTLPRELLRAGLLVAASCFVLVVSGTLATAAGPHAGGEGHIKRLWRLEPMIVGHAAVVGLFGCGFLFVLGYLAAARDRARPLFRLALGVLGALVVQMAIGEIQYRTHLPWWLVLVHVALASAVWAGVVALVTLMWRPTGALVGRT